MNGPRTCGQHAQMGLARGALSIPRLAGATFDDIDVRDAVVCHANPRQIILKYDTYTYLGRSLLPLRFALDPRHPEPCPGTSQEYRGSRWTMR